MNRTTMKIIKSNENEHTDDREDDIAFNKADTENVNANKRFFVRRRTLKSSKNFSPSSFLIVAAIIGISKKAFVAGVSASNLAITDADFLTQSLHVMPRHLPMGIALLLQRGLVLEQCPTGILL
mgnify:CR=1 FL=1